MYAESEIQNILSQGENSSVEFKSASVRPESLAREMASFANTGGGIILVGVGDAGDIEGVEDAARYEEKVTNIARNNVSPPLSVDCFSAVIDGKRIIGVGVPKGRDKPYQAGNRYYTRVGSTNRVATQFELLRLFQAAGLFHFDRTGVEGASMKDINLSAVDAYFRRYEIDFASEAESEKEKLLVNTDILTEERVPTIAGLLIFGLNPSRRLPQCGISFAHFPGNDMDGPLIDKQNIDGTLDYQVTTGIAVIRNNLLAPSDIKGAKREDARPMPPEKVFRELLVNACVHRNYAIFGSKIRVFMYNDRMEFISPGRLPNTVTVEKLKAGVSYATNPVIVKFMENLRFIDRLGRGLPMVFQEMQRSGGEAVFKEIGEEFKATLRWPPDISPYGNSR